MWNGIPQYATTTLLAAALQFGRASTYIGRMRKMLTAMAAVAAVLVSAPAAAVEPQAPRGEEVSIPFPRSGIRTWHAETDRILYVQDRSRRWYRVELMRPCLGIQYNYALGFDTRGLSRFDRFSYILARGQRCPVNSVVRSDPPRGKFNRNRDRVS
ncbi:MAG: DUF6491 family protein [Pseudomonadota bacterium]|nr:DUF6491 family protein [Pseudomonadota bacterium]